jgi:PAS domain S-box-containing protein
VNARTLGRLQPYLFAASVVVIALLLRGAANPWLGRSVPYLFFYPAIIVAATFGGFGPGVFAAALSGVMTALFYLEPAGGLIVRPTGERVALALFLANGVLISRLSGIARGATLSNQRLAAIVQSSTDAIVGKDLNGIIQSWNPGAERLFLYSSAEAIGQSITLIIPSERAHEEDLVLRRVRSGLRVEPFETVRRRKDGVEIDVALTVSPIRNAAGVVVGASKIARDISERRRSERMLEELVERERVARLEAVAARDRLAFLAGVGAKLTTTLDYSQTLDRAVHLAIPRLGDYCNVLIEDEHGRLRHVAWAHVNREQETVLRELALSMIESPPPGEQLAFATAVMKNGKTMVMAHDQVANAASHIGRVNPAQAAIWTRLDPYAYVGVPLSVRGRTVGVMSLGITGDRSRREFTDADVVMIEEFARRVSIAIENARLFRQADELNRLKDEFLATVSHELRTPLAAVLGWARMLAAGQLDPNRTKQAVDAIERNAQAQAKIVDDILDVARGIAGNVKLEMLPLDLAAVAHSSIEAIAPTAAGKRVELDVHAAAPVMVMGDQGRLRQVVWNLLSNAVKFTPAGGRVTVTVSADDRNAELQVADTGMGIPEGFLPFVFDKFRQADASFTRQHGGLGLGLAIARHLIELHGGSIEARSAGEGAGATFVVRLPLHTRGGRNSPLEPAGSAAARGVAHEIPDDDD